MANVLLLGSGNPLYRGYIPEGLARRGTRLTLLDRERREWIEPFVAEQLVVDLGSTEDVLRVALAAHRRTAFDGVFTYDEFQVPLCAMVAERLGLPGISQAAALRCRDKREMRRAFADAGVPSARSDMAATADQAARLAARFGYPVIVKPRNIGGSIGVARADDEKSLRALFRIAAEASYPLTETLPGVLVEEYLDGPDFSVESVVSHGRVEICGITEKTVGLAPYFVSLGHLSRPVGSRPEHARIREVVLAAHTALGVEYGATHAEVRMTPTGPRMVEVAARLAGDHIPYITMLASGVDQAAAAVATLTGATVESTPTRRRTAAIQMIFPPHDGVVRRLGIEDDASPPPWYEFAPYASVGDEVALPPRQYLTRLAHLIVVADDDVELADRMEQSMKRLDFEVEPAGGGRRS